MADSEDIIVALGKLKDDDELVNKLANSPFGKELVKNLADIANSSKVSNKDITALISAAKVIIRERQLGTKELGKYISNLGTDLKTYISSGRDLTGKEASASLVNKLAMSVGVKTVSGTPLVNPNKSDDPTVKELRDLKKFIKERDESNTIDKLKDLLGTPLKKTLKAVGSDLIESLGAERLIGGGFKDTIKLLTLLGASWLRQFGTLGKVLGVGLIAAGPFLASLIGKAIGAVLKGSLSLLGKAIGSGFKLLGGIFKTSISWLWNRIAAGLLAKSGAGISNWMWNSKSPVAQGMLNVATMSAGAKVAMAAEGGAAVGLGLNAVNAWKKGNRGEAVVSGISSAGFGLAALAPLLPFLAPIAPIALTVGAIGAGITLVIKYHKQIFEFLKSVLDWVKALFFGNKDNKESSAVNSGEKIGIGEKFVNALTPKDAQAVKSYGKVKVAKDGSILNADSLSQKELAAGIEQYRKEDPDRFNRVYELGGSDVASLGSFKNDAKTAGGALLYKGATQDLMNLRKALIAGGMSEEKANKLMYTSGMSSKDSGHVKKGWKSHSNRYALATDIAGSGWSQADYALAAPIVKSFYKERGWDSNFEALINGKHKFVDPSKVKGGTAWHFDTKPVADVRTQGAISNQQEFDRKANPVAQKTDLMIQQGKTQSTPEDKNKLYQSSVNDKPAEKANMSDAKTKAPRVGSTGKAPDYSGNSTSSYLLQTGLRTTLYGMDMVV